MHRRVHQQIKITKINKCYCNFVIELCEHDSCTRSIWNVIKLSSGCYNQVWIVVTVYEFQSPCIVMTHCKLNMSHNATILSHYNQKKPKKKSWKLYNKIDIRVYLVHDEYTTFVWKNLSHDRTHEGMQNILMWHPKVLICLNATLLQISQWT